MDLDSEAEAAIQLEKMGLVTIKLSGKAIYIELTSHHRGHSWRIASQLRYKVGGG
jgi:hypothetical protein